MTPTRPPLDEIKREGQARILDVLAALGVPWKRANTNYISICNPVVKDRHPSFTIWTAGAAAGAFKDHRGCAAGDLVDLVAYLKGWSRGNDKAGRKEAIEWLAGFLGLWNLTDGERERLRTKRQVAAATASARAARDLSRDQERARLAFYAAPGIEGTPVETYLASRGIELDLIPKGSRGGARVRDMPLRYLPAEHALAYHRESAKGMPCMLAGCVDWQSGKVKALHRTWLKPDGSGKADVEPNKKLWPAGSGLVIPLWRGESNLRLGEAIAAGLLEPLMLTEGIEDALTSVLREPELRTWAFISLGNLGKVVIPPCIDRVMLHKHYEPTNLTATKAFEAGRHAIWRQGEIEVVVREVKDPRTGKDFNDEWRVERARRKQWIESPEAKRQQERLAKYYERKGRGT